MPDFSYTARSSAGAIEKNIMSAASSRAVAEALRAQGLMPTLIQPVKTSFNVNNIFQSFQRIKLIDKITFIKNLGVMIKAGLPLSRSLKILTVQTPNVNFAKIIGDISHLVEGGTSLADALGKYPNIFSSIFINMVRVGEMSGTLEQNLNYLSDQLQRDYDLVSKVRGAMMYPMVVIVAMLVVGWIMFTFVLPKLTTTFTDLQVPLPISTRIVIGIVNIFAHYGILVMLGFIGLVVGFIYWRRSAPGRRVLHRAILYLPVVSGIVIKINLARFVRVFASLIKSGMPIVDALEVSSHVVGNIYYQQTIADASSKVKIGQPLTTAFKKQPRLFPNLVIQMMEVGEESGTTDSVLTEVANFYEADVDQTMKNLSSILEPVIMLVIGVGVGFLAVSLIGPIYNISQAIS